MTGNEAMALGCIAAAHRAERPLVYASYPITPASEILHELSGHKEFDVRVIQVRGRNRRLLRGDRRVVRRRARHHGHQRSGAGP